MWEPAADTTAPAARQNILGDGYISYLVLGIVGFYLHYPALGIVQRNRCNKKGRTQYTDTANGRHAFS